MPEQIPTIVNLVATLQERLLPTITVWNRLEGRPRTADFVRALRAEVRDPLWMVTKQWQMGEFRGDDAGTPVLAKLHGETAKLRGYRPAAHPARPLSEETPLEAQVEAWPIPFHVAGQHVSMDLRAIMGRQWLKLLAKHVGDFKTEYLREYALRLPATEDASAAPVRAHPEALQYVAAADGRLMDGYRLYADIDAGLHAYHRVSIPEHLHADVDRAAARFVAWFGDLFLQPEDDEFAWRPPYLEYQFACSAPEAQGERERVFIADEYYHGRLDWYNVDRDPASAPLGNDEAAPSEEGRETVTRTFIPAQVTYDGMPDTRWWAFEDRKVSLGEITPSTTDLGTLLLAHFGLVSGAPDWFLVPWDLGSGEATIRGLAVTNVFGERTWVEPAGAGRDDDWQRWAMFAVNARGQAPEPSDPSLLLLPTVAKTQEGPPVEDVMLLRDEVANMVWGVEKRISLPTGRTKPGGEAAEETYRFHRSLVERALAEGSLESEEVEYRAPIRYNVMSGVPEHWIPFIGVHVAGSTREIQLQRASLPRIIEGDPELPVKVEPRTVLLRQGLDGSSPEPYYVHEEEVTRAGVRLFRSFQRTRWYGGRVVTWLGARKQTGRGSGTSGFRFDTIEAVDQPDASSTG